MNALSKINDGSDGPPSTGTSRSLLERVKADDPAAWDRLVTLYAPMVFHWCRRWDLQDQDVADICQEVFQAVVAHIGTFRKERKGDTFRGWLRTIARNKLYDHFRRLGQEGRGVGGTDAQRRFAELPAPQPEEEDHTAAAEEHALFSRALELVQAEFEIRTWQAFWRTAIEGQSAQDVAADLGMSAGAVRVAKSRVLHRLREELGDCL
ncbi:MAG TPA: RNA polymerase sigma factor [Gemmataceae bacterium]|nr:RNA polymerase sigma factor [Gemmataceae bacterium]